MEAKVPPNTFLGQQETMSEEFQKYAAFCSRAESLWDSQIQMPQRTGPPHVPTALIYPLISEQLHRKLTGQKQDICHLSFLWVHGLQVGKYLMLSFPGWNDNEIDIYTSTYVHMDASTFTEGNISSPPESRQTCLQTFVWVAAVHWLQMTHVHVPFIGPMPRLAPV